MLASSVFERRPKVRVNVLRVLTRIGASQRWVKRFVMDSKAQRATPSFMLRVRV